MGEGSHERTEHDMYKQQSPDTAKSGQVRLTAHIGAAYVFRRILKILAFFALSNLTAALLFWTPLIGLFLMLAVGVLTWLLTLVGIVELILYCFGGVVMTENGIYGKDGRGKKFDLCFDRIQHFERVGNRIHVHGDVITKRGDVKRREYVLCMTNATEFEAQYQER